MAKTLSHLEPMYTGGSDVGSLQAPTVRMWLNREVKADELRQVHQNKWTSYWSWYRSKVNSINDPTQWWRSNEYVPTPFKIVETILPRYLLGMFEQPDWFGVEARNRRSEQYEQQCQSLLRTKLDQMKAFPEVYDAIKYCTIMGHVWGKVTWREEWATRTRHRPSVVPDPETGEPVGAIESEVVTEQTFNGPQFNWVPLDKLWADPSGRGRWYIEEILTTLEEIMDDQKNLDIYDKAELQRLRESYGYQMPGSGDGLAGARMGTDMGRSSGNVNSQESVNEYEGISESTVDPANDGLGCTLKLCWGWVAKEYRGEDGAEWRLTVIANDQFKLRDIPAPTPDGKPPYFAVRSIRIPGRLYGESILYYVGPMADQQSRMANMRLDEVFIGIWQQIMMRKGALASDNQMFFKPGGFMEVNVEPNQALSDNVMVMPRAPLLPQVWQEDSYRQVQAEHAAGASDIMQGVSGGDRTTATEVERKLQQGNARHVLQTMLFGYDFQKELLERTWEWLRMRMTTPELVKMGEEYAEINLMDIQAPIDITIGGGFFALSKATRVQMSQELVGLLQIPTFQQLISLNPKYAANIFRQLLVNQGWRNTDRFVPGEQELEQLIAKQKAEALVGQVLQEGMDNGAMGQDPSMGGGMGQEAGLGGAPMSDVPGMGGDAQLAGQPASDFGLAGSPFGT